MPATERQRRFSPSHLLALQCNWVEETVNNIRHVPAIIMGGVLMDFLGSIYPLPITRPLVTSVQCVYGKCPCVQHEAC